VVIEACSPAGWVHDLCEVLHLVCDVANTAGEAWKWKNVKRKTDRDDALKLARLSAVGELATVLVPAKVIRDWKSLIGLRKRLVGDRGRGQNRIRSLLVSPGVTGPAGEQSVDRVGFGRVVAAGEAAIGLRSE
jgi:transposase